VTEICREVLGRFPVTDLNVQEPEIEDVIRHCLRRRRRGYCYGLNLQPAMRRKSRKSSKTAAAFTATVASPRNIGVLLSVTAVSPKNTVALVRKRRFDEKKPVLWQAHPCFDCRYGRLTSRHRRKNTPPLLPLYRYRCFAEEYRGFVYRYRDISEEDGRLLEEKPSL
jgi:hypothetical protein